MRKILVVFITFLSFTLLVKGQVERKVYDEKNLRDPGSSSYVPIPYPKNDKELIENLKYAMKLHYGPDVVTFNVGRSDTVEARRIKRSDDVLGDFGLNRSSSLKVGKIHKIKHWVAHRSKDYFYIVELLDSENNVAFRVYFDASGLFGKLQAGDHHPLYTVSDQKVKESVKKVLKQQNIESGIKSIEKISVTYQNNLGIIEAGLYNTLLRLVTLENGEVYYACSGQIYGYKGYTHFMALYKLYERQVVKGVMKSFEFYKHIKSMRSKEDVRINNTLKGEFLYLSKVGDMFKYNIHDKSKTLVFQRDIK